MINEQYEVCWSGALEHDRQAPGLSSYRGHSSLLPFLSFERLDTFAPGEMGAHRPSRPRAAKLEGDREQAVIASLRAGASYRAMARAHGVTIAQARRVAALHEIPRRIGRPLGAVAA